MMKKILVCLSCLTVY